MRMTVEFDDDTEAAVEELQRSAGLGVSEAVNELIRRGLLSRERRHSFTQSTRSMGLKIDVSNKTEVLDMLEGSDAR